MVWRKWFCCLTFLVCFLVWGGMANTWAGEIDALHLINVLKKKGVLTDEEANELMKEVRTNTQKEKKEMQEEIKASGAKGDLLPSALKGFKLGATIFGEWNAKNESNGGKTTNEFALNRAYLTLTKQFNPWLGMNLTSDLFTSKDANDAGQGLELRIKYAMAELYLGGTTTEIGLTHTPSDQYDSAIWPYRVQGKHFLDNHGVQASADLGINIRGGFGSSLGEDFLKYGSKDYAGKWGGYQLGIYNGPGYSNLESNTDKALAGLIYFRPAPMVDLLQGLQLAYYGVYGKSNTNFADVTKKNDYPDWQVNVGQLSWQHKYFTVMGQYYWGKGTGTSTEDKDRKGYVAAGFMRIPGFEKMRIFGKYDYYDPDTNKSDNGDTTWTAGISYDFSKEFMPFIAYEHKDFEAKNTKDYDKLQVGFQLKF